MDLVYCDQCGEVIQGGRSGDGSLRGSSICESCREKKSGGSRPVSGGSSAGVARKKGESGGDSGFAGVLQTEGMDLFSSETIARRKAESEPRGQTRLKLVDSQGNERDGTRARGGESRATRRPASPTATQVGIRTVNPNASVAVPKSQSVVQPKSASAAIPRSGSMAGPKHPSAAVAKPGRGGALTLTCDEGVADGAVGSVTRSRSTGEERWKISCLHCNTQLSIKPVEKRSRVHCPRCSGSLVVDPDLRVTRAEGAVARGSEGERLAQFDSSVQNRSPGQANPAAVVSQLADMLRASPSSSASVRAGSSMQPAARGGSVAMSRVTGTALAAPQSGESTFIRSQTTVPQVDTSLATALLGDTARHGARRFRLGRDGSDAAGVDRVVAGILIAALPGFVGIGLAMLLEYPLCSDLLGAIGNDVLESLRIARGWLGR